ncbi:MAG: zinc-ribbon domain containing protein [Dehalococcoidia bacterium]
MEANHKDRGYHFEDKTLICIECGCEFIFESGEQQFYLAKSLIEPKRCPECRRRRKATITRRGGADG